MTEIEYEQNRIAKLEAIAHLMKAAADALPHMPDVSDLSKEILDMSREATRILGEQYNEPIRSFAEETSKP